MRYIVSGVTHKGKIRSVNQDNLYCEGYIRDLDYDELGIEGTVSRPGQWIAAVFDGMGGEKDGEIASLLASEETKNAFSNSQINIDISGVIYSINNRICDEMAKRKCRMGSTCVILEFNDSMCRSWNVGDSRAYHYHNALLEQLSVDHTEAASLDTIFGGVSGKIRGSENSLTQHLGIKEEEFIIEPFVSEWEPVNENDLFLICSDGLTHMVKDEAISKIFGSGMTLQEKRETLLDLAMEKGGQDNITIILIEAMSRS